MPKLAGCVVFYNPEDDTYENILSYISGLEKLMVVDNSTKKNEPLIFRLKNDFNDKLIYIDNGDNLGIATALNIACDKAIELGYEWMLTMDQDSKFINFEHYLKCLDVAYNLENVGLLAANTNGKNNKNKKITNFKENKFIVITSANIVNLKYFNQVGRYNDELFIDMVDYEFCIKINIAKLKILYFEQVFVMHKLGEVHLRKNLLTRKVKYKTEHNSQRAYYIARNYMYVSKKYSNIFPKNISMLRTINDIFIHDVTKILLYEENKMIKLKAKFLGLWHFIIGKMGRYDL